MAIRFCVFSKTLPCCVRASRRQRRGLEGADYNEVGEHPQPSSESPLDDALSRVGLSMQRQLLEDKIFNLVVAWCDTPQKERPGCSFNDWAILHDVSPNSPVTMVGDSPDNDIYHYISHNLRGALQDPLLAQATAGVRKFYTETFWLNTDAPWLTAQCPVSCV